MDKQIIDALQLIAVLWGGFFAAYKAVTDVAKERTKQKETEAKENSLGKEALLIIKEEIKALQHSTNEDGIKLQRIEQIIQSLEFTYKLIEQRMLAMFPSNQNK